MKIGVDNALGIAPHALMLRAQRTSLLANNIANADTPGFKAQDINFQAVLAAQTGQNGNSVSLAKTHAQHMTTESASMNANLQYRQPLMASLDGNTVDTQMEQAEFAENSLMYLTSLRILNGRITGMMSAIKGE